MLKTKIIAAVAVTAAGAALTAASAGIWYGVFSRCQEGRPVIPLDRRRPAPWLGRDVLFLLLIAISLPGLALVVAGKVTGINALAEAAGRDVEKADDEDKDLETAHPAAQLLRKGDWRMVAVATIIAVIAAPIFEEFFFRVVLQGWLEAVWSRRRRTQCELREPPLSWMPLVLPALLFAMMHIRIGRQPPTPQHLNVLFFAHVVRLVADAATICLAIGILRIFAGATAVDLGWQPRKLPKDAKLALLALIAAVPPIMLLQGSLVYAIKQSGVEIAPDPLPLFFLALVFGWLYRRTHRIAPSLVMHMAFNATSVATLFLGSQG